MLIMLGLKIALERSDCFFFLQSVSTCHILAAVNVALCCCWRQVEKVSVYTRASWPSATFFFNGELRTGGKGGIDNILSHINWTHTMGVKAWLKCAAAATSRLASWQILALASVLTPWPHFHYVPIMALVEGVKCPSFQIVHCISSQCEGHFTHSKYEVFSAKDPPIVCLILTVWLSGFEFAKQLKFFNDFLSVPFLLVSSRGQLTLAWTWPDKTLVVYELTSRQAPQPTTRAPGQGGAVISECPGQPGRPYCKELSLLRAQAKDTGYYSCYYKDVKATTGTTAVDVYVFVRGESLSNDSPTHTID